MDRLRIDIITVIVLLANVLLTSIKTRQESNNKIILEERENRRIKDAEELEERRQKEFEQLQLAKEREEQRAIYTTDALMAISRQFIVSEHRRIKERVDEETQEPFIYIHERDSLTKLNKAYHNLGGNGLVQSLMGDIERFPVKQR